MGFVSFWRGRSAAGMLSLLGCQPHLCNLQTTNNKQRAAACISSISTPFKCPCKLSLQPLQWSACDSDKADHTQWNSNLLLPSANRFVVFTAHFSKAMCLPASGSALTFFSLCVLRADVKVSASPARRSGRYDETNPSDLPKGLFTQKPQRRCGKCDRNHNLRTSTYRLESQFAT